MGGFSFSQTRGTRLQRPGSKSLAQILAESLRTGLGVPDQPLDPQVAGQQARLAAGLEAEAGTGAVGGEGSGGASSISAPPYEEVEVGEGRSQLGPVAPQSFAQGLQRNIAKGLGQHPYDTAEGPLRSAETPASATKAPIRAIRLPNGKLLFTNQNYGGDEIVGGPAAAGTEIRAQDRDRSRAATSSPVGDTMLGLVRAAAGDQRGALVDASRRQAGMRGETASPAEAAAPTRRAIGPEFDSTPGGLSMIEGTPEQQDELAMESGEREITKGMMAQALQRSTLPLAEAAAIDNPRIQIAHFLDQFGPQMDQIVEDAETEKVRVSTSGLTPAQQSAEIARIEALRDAYLKNIRDRMSVIGGQTLSQYQ